MGAEVIDTMAPKVLQMKAATGQRDEALEYAVMAVLHAAVTLRNSDTSPGIELECKICGQRDDQHTRSCLIPALEVWLNPV